MAEEEEKRRWRGGKAVASPASERLKAGQRLKESSRRWLERQIRDPYAKQARQEGWRSRAAFKLAEIDDRWRLIKRGALVCDLGAAPGGWAQVALERGAARVVGIDVLPVEALAGAEFLHLDFLDDGAVEALLSALGGKPDLVLSDMAANTTGHRATDQIKTGALAEAAIEFAQDVLAPGGGFCCKVFQGGLDGAALAGLKVCFEDVRHVKPPASRTESSEVYVLARGFRGER